MKMLALMTDAYGHSGGIARFNRDFVDAFCAIPGNGADVIVRHKSSGEHQIPINASQTVRRSRISFVGDVLKRSLRRNAFDVLFCGHLHLVELARWATRVSGSELWLQLHGIEAWQKPSNSARDAAESCHRVLAVSRYTRHRFLDWCGIDPARVKVLPNTVQSKFTPGPKRNDLLERYGLKDKKIILTVGRLSKSERYKGHDRIIQSLSAVLKCNPNTVYLIAGEGDDRDRLENLARGCGVPDHVKFIGAIAEEDLPDIYRLADVFAMPSTGEGFGIAYLEAASSGVPVIGNGEDGSWDALLEGRVGRALRSSAPEILESALNEALSRSIPPDTKAVQIFSRDNFFKHVSLLFSKQESA